jgi:hypothetical protein
MPEIFIRNYKRIASADLSFSAIALCAAPNETGKSSLAEAIRAALTGEGIALDGGSERLTKKDSAPQLVRWGEMKGSAMVRTEDGATAMFWPKCEAETDGLTPPHASRMAAGLDSLARMKPEERARFLVGLLEALPTYDELLEALTAAEINKAEEVAKAVWSIIEKDGWDVCQKKAKEKGALLKGRWSEVTGENWGAEKAAAWQPAAWNPKWDALTPEMAEAGLAKITAELAAFDTKRGAAGADRSALETKAARLPELEAAKATLPDLEAIGQALIAAEEARKALPQSAGDPEVTHPCPECGAVLAVAPGQTPPWKKASGKAPTKTEVQRIAKAIADANTALLSAKRAMDEANRTVIQHDADLRAAQDAVEALKALPASEGGTDEARAFIVARIAQATAVGKMIVARIRASEVDAQVRANIALVGILAPDGLRQQKLATTLAEFNEALGVLSVYMGCGHVIVRPDMAIMVAREAGEDAVAYWQMSASQQFRTRIVLQIAVARLDGSSMVVIDNDVDQDSRWLKGTLRLLLKAQIPALITVRADRVEDMLDLSGAPEGAIKEYWIRGDGMVVPTTDLVQQAA